MRGHNKFLLNCFYAIFEIRWLLLLLLFPLQCNETVSVISEGGFKQRPQKGQNHPDKTTIAQQE